MRMTTRKKEILSFFAPENAEYVTREIGPPPFDVSGIAYLLHGMESFNKKSIVESVRRTLEGMTAADQLERVSVYERRQNTTQGSADSAGVWCTVNRYGLPGQCLIMKDDGEGKEAIEGEYSVLNTIE